VYVLNIPDIGHIEYIFKNFKNVITINILIKLVINNVILQNSRTVFISVKPNIITLFI